MATLKHAESRRMYSWWWDSHIPKNSKWLQENLTDMDAKVKAMIKLIEEDADSFARRAEMYYKKRPELMKLVEEFYRAYRALAERYDQTTGALRQAHRTMAEAFPNHIPFALPDDSPSSSSAAEGEPHTPDMSHPMRAIVDPDDLHKDALGLSSSHSLAISRKGIYSDETESVPHKKGLKQLNDLFDSGEGEEYHAKSAEGRVRKGLNFHVEDANEAQIASGSSRAGKAEIEVQTLKEGLAKLEAEKEAGLLQYRQSLERLSNLETEISQAQEDARGLDERAWKAETEVQTLKQALAKLEAEKEAELVQYQQSLERLSNLENEFSLAQEGAKELNDRAGKAETEVETLKQSLVKLEAEKEAGLLQYSQYLDRISNLESKISRAEEHAGGLTERARKAETETETLNQVLCRFEAEKEAGLVQYKQCLATISSLESKLAHAAEEAGKLKDRADKAESDVQSLKQDIAKLNEEKVVASLQYQGCLGTISDLETEISRTQEETKRLKNEIALAGAKLNSALEQYLLLEKENRSLKAEVESLTMKTEMQKQELLGKEVELERLHKRIQEETLRSMQAEGAIQTLQNLHSQSQEEQKLLTMELQKGVLMLKDMERWSQGLDDELRQVKEENKNLNNQVVSSATSINNLHAEILRLKELIAKLEEEVGLRLDQRNALQQEIYCLKEEINDLNKRHQGVIEQVESVGLNPDNLGSSVKDLQYQNSELKEIFQKESDEKVTLMLKLEEMGKILEKNALLENSLSDVNVELEGLREKVKALEESCQYFQAEISTLDSEKATLVSQLDMAMENMEKLTEKNTLLENSLSDTNVELESLRAKSKSLQDFCQSLDNERSGLLTERDTLVSHLKRFQQTLDELQKKCIELEEKYSGLEKEKASTIYQVEELRVSLNLEKQEHANFVESSEIRLTHLEGQVRSLQEESCWRKKEFEEEQERAIKAQVEIFILQRCIRDMEEKNFSLFIECQKHFEQSTLSENLISELEEEFLDKQLEAKSLLSQIENLRLGIQEVLKSRKIHPNYEFADKIKDDQVLLQHIVRIIEDAEMSLLKTQDEKQQLLFEKSVLVTLVEQLGIEMSDIESERITLDQNFKICTEELLMLQSEKQELLEMNGELTLEVRAGEKQEKVLKDEMASLLEKLSELKEMYHVLQDESYKLHERNRSLMMGLSELEEEKCLLEEENNFILGEAIAVGNVSLILNNFSAEKVVDLKRLGENLNNLHGVNSALESEIVTMREKWETVENENAHLKQSVEELGNKLNTAENLNDQLNHQLGIGKEMFNQKEMELSEALTRIKATQSTNEELLSGVEILRKECDDGTLKRVELEKQILELSEDNTHQREEIGCLHEANWRLESEVAKLHDEIASDKFREECLSSELIEKRNEVEFQEAEAAALHVDLHYSTICEVLFKEKAHEIIGACESLEVERASKIAEIEELKERLHVLEGENSGMKSELTACSPMIVALRDSLVSLEDHVVSRTKILGANDQKNEEAGLVNDSHDMNSQILSEEEQNLAMEEEISDLRALQDRVKAVEKAVVEMERLAIQESFITNIKLQAAMKEIEELKSSSVSFQVDKVQTGSDIVLQLEKGKPSNQDLQKIEPTISKGRNGIVMKDIPLDQVSECPSYDHGFGSHAMSRRKNSETDDQMLELWETSEKGSHDRQINNLEKMELALTMEDTSYYQIEAVEELKSEYPSSELQIEKELGVDKQEILKGVGETRQGNRRKILERLASDAQKLTNLQITVQDLKNKIDMSNKSKATKGKGLEYDTLRGQLHEVEEAIMELFDINGKLTMNAEGSPSPSDRKAPDELKENGKVRRRRVSEQARKGSEKIGRLQLEVQRIQFVLLKLEDEYAIKAASTPKRSTRVLLRDYIYSGGKSNRRKKGACCACMRPATKSD